jgi:hypothetical protein
MSEDNITKFPTKMVASGITDLILQAADNAVEHFDDPQKAMVYILGEIEVAKMTIMGAEIHDAIKEDS